jgi:hypothetical protein
MRGRIYKTVRFEVLTVVNMKIKVLWNLTCSLVDRYQCFEELALFIFKLEEYVVRKM